jgi:hypothetical protein
MHCHSKLVTSTCCMSLLCWSGKCLAHIITACNSNAQPSYLLSLDSRCSGLSKQPCLALSDQPAATCARVSAPLPLQRCWLTWNSQSLGLRCHTCSTGPTMGSSPRWGPGCYICRKFGPGHRSACSFQGALSTAFPSGLYATCLLPGGFGNEVACQWP